MARISSDLPNLIIAGLPKCGTTSLFSYLDAHPQICGSSIKEPDFFRPRGDHAPLRLEQYSALFSSNPSATWRMEASVHYFWGGREVAQDISRTLTNPRIIISLREPARRLWSAYTFTKSRGAIPITESFPQTFERWQAEETAYLAGLREEPSPIGLSNYAAYLGPWLEAFGSDLRVIFLEDMARSAASEVEKLFRWLELEPLPSNQMEYERRNPTVSPRSQIVARAAHFARQHTNTWLRNTPIFRDALRRAYSRVNTAPTTERLDDATAQSIRALCADSNAQLGALLEQHGYTDLPGWVT